MDIVRMHTKTIQDTTEDPFFGKMGLVSIILVEDETERPITNDELVELHQRGLGVGYHVRLKGEYLYRADLISLGVVHDVEPRQHLVSLGEGHWISLNEFHSYYELDR